MWGTASAGSYGSVLIASTRDSSAKMLLLGSSMAIFSSPAVDSSAIGVPSARYRCAAIRSKSASGSATLGPPRTSRCTSSCWVAPNSQASRDPSE